MPTKRGDDPNPATLADSEAQHRADRLLHGHDDPKVRAFVPFGPAPRPLPPLDAAKAEPPV
jgi:hypothetical protein